MKHTHILRQGILGALLAATLLLALASAGAAQTPTPVPCRSTIALGYSKSVSGQITNTVKQVCYQFQGKRGDRMTVTMKKTKGTTTFDPTLELRGPRNLRLIDDVAKADAKISLALTVDGVYTIVASSRKNQGIGSYTLTLTK